MAATADTGARKRKKRQRRGQKSRTQERRQRRRGQVQSEARRCCSRNNCTPGRGKNLYKCCYEDRDLSDQNFRGANLGLANFSGADVSNADFRGANLGQTCFVETDIRGARFGGANLGGAIFCRTQTENGEDNSGCGLGTRCCPTCDENQPCAEQGEICCGGRCVAGACCNGRQGVTCAGTENCCAPDGCVDVQTDPDNCGECGNACARDETCVDGSCEQPPVCDVCASGCLYNTLRDALGDESLSTIRICPGAYPTTNVEITRNVTVIGAGSGDNPAVDTFLHLSVVGTGLVLTIPGSASGMVGATVRLENLRISGGRNGQGNGGGIFNKGDLTLSECVVTDNTGFNGGGIYVDQFGRLFLAGSSVRDNRAEFNGGGIHNLATVTLQANSSVTRNRVGALGGGIYNDGTVTLEAGSSVTDNRAGDGVGDQDQGGGIFIANGTVNLLAGSSVTLNTAELGGGGIFRDGGTVNIADDGIVTNNIPDNCSPVNTITNCAG